MTEQTPLVHTGIIAAAGSAARMWPASKVFPKELFPLGRIPVLVHVIQEMVAAGIRKIVIVVRPDGSNTIQMMLDRKIPPPDNARGDAVVREFDELLAAASFSFVPQSGRYGNGTPLLDGLPSTDGGPLVYAFADDVVMGENASAGLIRTFERTRHPVLAAQQVPDLDVSKFGILEYTSRDGAKCETRFVEKPTPGQTTSRFASWALPRHSRCRRRAEQHRRAETASCGCPMPSAHCSTAVHPSPFIDSPPVSGTRSGIPTGTPTLSPRRGRADSTRAGPRRRPPETPAHR